MTSRPSDPLELDLLALDEIAAEATAPSAGLRERVLASRGSARPLAGLAPRLASFLDLPAERAEALLRAAGEPPGAAWVDDRVPGVRLLHFEGGARHAGADCGLVHLPAGARYPLHRHLGEEWVFVLSGSAEEESTGEQWGPGDLCRRDAGSAHAFRATASVPFVFAVVLREGIALEEPPAPPAG
jgi:quercetin dioxygenase-like cupin family protein